MRREVTHALQEMRSGLGHLLEGEDDEDNPLARDVLSRLDVVEKTVSSVPAEAAAARATWQGLQPQLDAAETASRTAINDVLTKEVQTTQSRG